MYTLWSQINSEKSEKAKPYFRAINQHLQGLPLRLALARLKTRLSLNFRISLPHRYMRPQPVFRLTRNYKFERRRFDR